MWPSGGSVTGCSDRKSLLWAADGALWSAARCVGSPEPRLRDQDKSRTRLARPLMGKDRPGWLTASLGCCVRGRALSCQKRRCPEDSASPGSWAGAAPGPPPRRGSQMSLAVGARSSGVEAPTLGLVDPPLRGSGEERGPATCETQPQGTVTHKGTLPEGALSAGLAEAFASQGGSLSTPCPGDSSPSIP